MKVVVFTDVHGSLNSLKAFMDLEDFKTADKIVFLGDVSLGCSRANECIDLLKTIDCVCLLGNNDGYVADHIPEVDRAEFDNVKLEMIDWMRGHISDANKDYMKSWPREYYMNINGKVLYFTHYVWENCNNDINVIDSPKTKDLSSRKEMFKDIKADYIIFGHEHKPSYFVDNDRHYYCLDTMGLKCPGAYLVINARGDKIKLEEKFVDFDINEEIDLMDKAGYKYNKSKIKRTK